MIWFIWYDLYWCGLSSCRRNKKSCPIPTVNIRLSWLTRSWRCGNAKTDTPPRHTCTELFWDRENRILDEKTVNFPIHYPITSVTQSISGKGKCIKKDFSEAQTSRGGWKLGMEPYSEKNTSTPAPTLITSPWRKKFEISDIWKASIETTTTKQRKNITILDYIDLTTQSRGLQEYVCPLPSFNSDYSFYHSTAMTHSVKNVEHKTEQKKKPDFQETKQLTKSDSEITKTFQLWGRNFKRTISKIQIKWSLLLGCKSNKQKLY